MENNFKLQLGQYKSVNEINQDMYVPIQLDSETSLLSEYEQNNVLNVNDQFELERQASTKYMIYGEIEYLSVLNNITLTPTRLEDYFTILQSTNKTILNSFQFSIVKPNNNYLNTANNKFIEYHETVSNVTINMFPAGYSTNIFGEKTYIYIANDLVTVDNNTLSGTTGYTKPYFPVTDLYLYCKYIPQTGETIKRFDINSNSYIEIESITDNIYGCEIDWNKEEYLKTEYTDLKYQITTPYVSGSTNHTLVWNYNPLIKIPIDVLGDDLHKVVSGGTNDYDDPIPIFATMLDNSDYIWREIEEKGYVNPLTGLSINPPFMNNNHYVFNKIKLSIVPELLDSNTNNVFSELNFQENVSLISNDLDNLNGANNKC